LFFLDGRIDALHQSDWVPTVPNPTTHTYVLADVEADVGGYGARIGAELYLHERFQIGLQFTSPTVVNVRAKQVREETQQVANDVGSFVRVETETDTEYLLPYRVEGAIAVPIRDFLVCAQFNYANWSEAAIDGQRVFTQQSDSVLRRTVGLAAGVEWRPAPTPLRLQAGFEYAPGALKYLQTDRIDNDGIERAEKDSGRTRVSAGAGWLVRGRLVLDAAFVRTQESREADLLADEYRAWQVSLQGTYWF
jgi:long-subunit fatty acid transport protein